MHFALLMAGLFAVSVAAASAQTDRLTGDPNAPGEVRVAGLVDQINRLTLLIETSESRLATAFDLNNPARLSDEALLSYYRQRGRLHICDGRTEGSAANAFNRLDNLLVAFVGDGFLGIAPSGTGGSTQRPGVTTNDRFAAYSSGVSSRCPNPGRLRARILAGPMGQLRITENNRAAAAALRQRYERILLDKWSDVELIVPQTAVESLD